MNELELERYYENTFAHFESAIEDYRLRAVFRDMSKKRINYIHIASILNEQKKYLNIIEKNKVKYIKDIYLLFIIIIILSILLFI
jgi:hypothetical protein